MGTQEEKKKKKKLSELSEWSRLLNEKFRQTEGEGEEEGVG